MRIDDYPARSNGGSFLVGLYALSAVLLFGFVVLDQIYARVMAEHALAGGRAAVFSEVADFLLQFTLLATLIAIGAIAAAWRQQKTQWLLAASVLSGSVLPALFLAGIGAFAPGALAALDGTGAGPVIRFVTCALSAVFGVWGWLAYTRGAARPSFAETAD